MFYETILKRVLIHGVLPKAITLKKITETISFSSDRKYEQLPLLNRSGES